MKYEGIEKLIGNTPLVRLNSLYSGSNEVYVKLEGQNPGGSVKDRPALQMIKDAESRGDIKAGDTLIEATSGNTGIALAMVARLRNMKMVLVMPEHMSRERVDTMKAFGAEIILTSRESGMEGAIDRARELEASGEGIILNQFANPSNPLAHYLTTGPEVWKDTEGRVTHFVASTGSTGTIMGVSRYLKEQSSDIQIVAARPDFRGGIPGIRAWPDAYLPSIYEEERIDRKIEVSRSDAVDTAKALASEEGIFGGISSGGNVFTALQLARELDEKGVTGAVIVTVICDRGDRYLTTGVFS